jgi:hypothetical protein
LNSILNREGIEITCLRPIGKQMAVVYYKAISEEVLPLSNNTNIYIASTTTAWARMELYKYLSQSSSMDGSSSSAVYCDTDSIFYHGTHLPTGPHLGELTSELPIDDVIVRFVSAGPKTYAYQTRNGNVCIKAKGFSLNYSTLRVFNLQGMESLIDGFVDAFSVSNTDRVSIPPWKGWRREKRDERIILRRMHPAVSGSDDEHGTSRSSTVIDASKGISVLNAHRIVRSKLWELGAREEQKMFAVYFNKRIVLSNFDTLPFGYCVS